VAIESERLRREADSKPWQLVYIDHDHRLDNLVEHVNVGLGLAADAAVFLFDDAVPPEIGMAGPEPSQSWWVGEVWMLKRLLRAAGDGFFCMAADLKPTGLMAAAGFAPIRMAEILPDYRSLNGVDSLEQLTRLLELNDPEEIYAAAVEVLNIGVDQTAVVLEAGGSGSFGLSGRRVICEPQGWLKPAPVFCVDLSSGAHDLSRIRHGELLAAGQYIDSFSDCHLVGFSGLIKNARYFDHWTNTDDADLLTVARNNGTYANQQTQIFLKNDLPAISRDKLAGAQHIGEPVMFGTPDEPDNWGMWLLLGLPSVREFLEHRERYAKFMTCIQHPWQRKLLAAVGLRDEDVIEHNRTRSYLCGDISILRKSYRDMFISLDEAQYFQSIASRFARQGDSPPASRIFISRLTRTERDGGYRGLLNERELIAALQSLRFEIFEPEYMRFEDQVALFHGADIVVGLGGAGMFNAIFCKPGAHVVTIESGVGFVHEHTNIFGSMGLDYGVILGDEDPTDPRPYQRRWTLNVAAAMERIRGFV
jgi:capsular polysaccharide biosynthesis protein